MPWSTALTLLSLNWSKKTDSLFVMPITHWITLFIAKPSCLTKMGNSFYPKLRKILLEHHCQFKRQAKGSHELWSSPISKKVFTVPVTIDSGHTATTFWNKPDWPKNLKFNHSCKNNRKLRQCVWISWVPAEWSGCHDSVWIPADRAWKNSEIAWQKNSKNLPRSWASLVRIFRKSWTIKP